MQKRKYIALFLVVCLLLPMLTGGMGAIWAAEAAQEHTDSVRVQPLIVSDQINYVRIWARRHITDQSTRPDSQLITAISPAVTGVSTVTVESAWDRNHVFRLIAVPGDPDWFYIVAMAGGNVLTNSGGSITLAPRIGSDSNQHWRLIYTEESLYYYHWTESRPGFASYGWGAVTHGVYRHIQNRETLSYLTNMASNPAPPAALPMVTGVPLVMGNAVGRNDISTQWNIVTVDYEAMVRGPVPDTRSLTSWEEFAITSPLRDRLNAAGRIRLTWFNANGFNPGITGYNIYVNGVFDAFVPQSPALSFNHYFYAVTVEMHTLRVDALIGSYVVASSEINYFITNKGLAAGAPLRAPAMGQAWYYTWGTSPVPGMEQMEFVPMRWGGGTSASIQGTVQTAINEGYVSILGFNEPDLPEEANIPVQEVIDRWMDSFVPFRDQIRLVSPVTAWPNSMYMHSMLDGVHRRNGPCPHPNCHERPFCLLAHYNLGDRDGIMNYVDVIAYHDYQDWATFTNFRNAMQRTRELWPNHPIWITELGARSPASNRWPYSNVYGFGPTNNLLYNGFSDLMNFMTDEYWVERYAWFTFRPHNPGSPFVGGVGTNYRGMRTTYDPHTGALWPLGILFRELGNPVGYVLPPLEPEIDAAGSFDIWLPNTADIIDLPQPVASQPAPATITVGDYLIGLIEWYPVPVEGYFAEGVLYTATIRLQAASDRSYQMGILPRDFFVVPDAYTATNPAGSGVVTAIFPRTLGIATQFTVTFVNYDGTEVVEPVYAGGSVTPPVFARAGFTFMRWNIATTGTSNFNNVTANITATAVFYQDRIVRFYNWNGELLEQQTVPHGLDAAPPIPPLLHGYAFIGWDTVVTNVTQNLNVTAVFVRDPWFIGGDLAFRRPISASSTNSVMAPYRAVNGDVSINANGAHASVWQPNANLPYLNHNLTVDLGAEFDIGEIEIIWGIAGTAPANFTDAMRYFEILVTDDPRAMDSSVPHANIVWQTVAQVSNPVVDTRYDRPLSNFIYPENAVNGRFIRLRVTNTTEVYTQWPRVAAFRVFEDNPVGPFSILIEEGGIGASVNPPRAVAGEKITINAGIRIGYDFAGWITTDQITLASATEALTTFDMIAQRVVLAASWTPAQHSITFEYDYALDAIISHAQAAVGTVVTIDAGTKQNYNFVGWTSTPVVVFSDAAELVTTFAMIGEPVIITANWVYAYADTLPITIIGGGVGSGVTPYEAAEGMTVTLNAGTKEGHLFIGWTSEQSIAFANASNVVTTFVMPEEAVTVTANWSSSTIMPPAFGFSAAGGRFYRSYVRVDLSTLRSQQAGVDSDSLHLRINLSQTASNTNASGMARWHGHQAGNVGARFYLLDSAPVNNRGTFYRDSLRLTQAARSSLGITVGDAIPFSVDVHRAGDLLINLHLTFDGGIIPAGATGYLDIPIVYFTNNTGRPLASVTLTNVQTSQVLIYTMPIPLAIPGACTCGCADCPLIDCECDGYCGVILTPTVTSVTISPSLATVQQGNVETFTATVVGTNNPAQTVTWSVEGNTSIWTTISEDGILTVAADELSAALTVVATSKVDTTIYDKVTVTVIALAPAEFGLHVFNNAVINNQSLANGGIIRIWTRIDGVNALVPYSSLTVTAVFPNGECAMNFVSINRMWNNQDYVNLIDVNMHAPWQRIYLTATLHGQTVELTLVNPRLFSLQAFNNGVINNQSLANNGVIRVWTLLSGINALVPNSLVVTAIDQDGGCAMYFVRVNEPWGSQGYVNLIDVNFEAQWLYIYFTATVFGQTVELVLVNPRPPVAVPEFSLNVFNNGVINNQSLADAGLIRIWTRLDGVPMNVLITEITAIDQSGNDAIEHLRRVNTVGESPQNGFDVNFHASWQQIYLTVKAYGQTLELTLVNPMHV